MTNVDRAARVLRAFVEDRAARRRYGARARQIVHAARNRGELPRGYYPEWFVATVNRVLGELRDAANEFSGRYTWHELSNDDLVDILKAAAGALEDA